jgi:hypothetical protein
MFFGGKFTLFFQILYINLFVRPSPFGRTARFCVRDTTVMNLGNEQANLIYIQVRVTCIQVRFTYRQMNFNNGQMNFGNGVPGFSTVVSWSARSMSALQSKVTVH